MMSKPPDTIITVLLVDDHAVVREGYRRLLERSGNIAVIGEAADSAAAHSAFCRLDPHIVVMDITLPGAGGIEVMRRMLALKPGTRVLMFSMHEEAIFAKRALQAGASGYVTKSSAPDVLVQAVHAVAAGRKFLGADIAQNLALRQVVADPEAADGLSAREFEVLRLLATGQSVTEIAQCMNLNSKTISNHQSSIKKKLGVETAVQLLARAAQLGLGRTD
jgi:DNA-binding NarL/FixJ family response regulator